MKRKLINNQIKTKMKNKELVLRRMESLEGKLKRLRSSLNERNIDDARIILQEVLELRDDIQSMVEREN
jgi:cell shape-determining protein MreC